jgi:hypothetical protein
MTTPALHHPITQLATANVDAVPGVSEDRHDW